MPYTECFLSGVGALPEIWIELKALYGRKFAQDILFILEPSPLRYTDIQTGVTLAKRQTLHPHTLSTTLDWLQQHGYIEHRLQDGAADYRLTPDGQDLVRILGEINRMYRRRRKSNDDG